MNGLGLELCFLLISLVILIRKKLKSLKNITPKREGSLESVRLLAQVQRPSPSRASHKDDQKSPRNQYPARKIYSIAAIFV